MTLRQQIVTRIGCVAVNCVEERRCAKVGPSDSVDKGNMTRRSDDKGTVDPFDSKTWAPEDKAYFNAIDDALENADPRYISNGRPEHAAFLVHRFLENANKVVRIYSGGLTRSLDGVDVYGNSHIIGAARKFLRRDGRILIAVQNDIDLPSGGRIDDHPFVGSTKDHCMGKLVIKKAADTDKLTRFHWMVMDKSAYRLETDVEKATAHANFGTPEFAAQLALKFDTDLYAGGETLFEWSRGRLSDR